MKTIREIRESRTLDSGGNVREGARLAVEQVLSAMPSSKKATRTIQPEDISIREAFDELVLAPMIAEGKSTDAIKNGSAVAIAEAINTSQFPRLLGRMSEVTVLDAYELALEGAERLVYEKPGLVTTGDTWFGNRITGREGPEQVFEADAYEQSHLGEFEVSIALRKFGRMFEVTMEMVMADKTGDVLDMARSYGEQMGLHRQTMIFEAACGRASTQYNILGAAVDTFRVNGTGYAMYSTDHAAIPGSGGQANSNHGTLGLTPAGLSAALLLLRKQVDIHGQPLSVNPKFLIVAPEQEEIAYKLNTFSVEPGLSSGGLDGNIFKGRFTTIVDPAGTAGTWYVGNFPKQLYWIWAIKPRVETIAPQERALTNDIVMLSRAMYKGGVGNVDHRFAAVSHA